MIVFLSTLFVQAGVSLPVNSIEQICRCPDEKLNTPNLCHKLQRLLNYAIYDRQDDIHVTSSSVGCHNSLEADF